MNQKSNSTLAAAVDVEDLILKLLARDAVKVPPYPAVALKMRDLVSRADFGLDEVLALAAVDQALAANVLRCANSALYGRGNLTSLRQAVGVVGAQEVARLALVSQLAGTAHKPGALQSLKRKVWQDAVASSLLCQLLAKKRLLAQDDAFICGLLHDFGWMVGIEAIEEVLARHPTTARPETWWTALLDRLHGRLGLLLVTRWKLPGIIADTIRLHHARSTAESAYEQVIAVVAASDAVVALLAEKPSVTPKDLEQIPGLTEPECIAIASALPELARVIASFEDDSPTGESAAIQPTPAGNPAGIHPLQLEVMQVSPVARGPYEMTWISPCAWAMWGPEPLPLGKLMEVELPVAPQPLRFWAKAMSCTQEGGRWAIECRPFALHGPIQAAWDALVASAQERK